MARDERPVAAAVRRPAHCDIEQSRSDQVCADGIRVEVVIDLGPHQTARHHLRLPAGATAIDALRASGLVENSMVANGDVADEAVANGDVANRDVANGDVENWADIHIGCWGRLVSPTSVLRDLDRVELYRPLQVDPKEARRQRYRRDGLTNKPAPRRK